MNKKQLCVFLSWLFAFLFIVFVFAAIWIDGFGWESFLSAIFSLFLNTLFDQFAKDG